MQKLAANNKMMQQVQPAAGCEAAGPEQQEDEHSSPTAAVKTPEKVQPRNLAQSSPTAWGAPEEQEKQELLEELKLELKQEKPGEGCAEQPTPEQSVAGEGGAAAAEDAEAEIEEEDEEGERDRHSQFCFAALAGPRQAESVAETMTTACVCVCVCVCRRGRRWGPA